MSGRPSEESGTSDLMCFTREVPMAIVRSGDLGKAIIPSKLVRVLVRPTTMHAHVHVCPRPSTSTTRGSVEVEPSRGSKSAPPVRPSLASHWRPAACVGGCGVGPGGPRGVEHGDKPANAVPARCPNMTH